MFRRIGFFLLVNLGVLITISVVLNIAMSVFGLQPYLSATGLNIPSLLVFALIWGFAGSFISLAISRWMAVRAMGVQVIESAQTAEERKLVGMVEKLANRAGVPMPQVGVFDSPEINAFATGPSKAKSLVAVSTGLLAAATDDELEAILGHEVAHIANGDMVTMTLLQGVINAFVLFFARIAAFVVAQALRERDSEGLSQLVYFVAVMIFDIVFSILGSIVVSYFSRVREYRADAGGAKFAGKEKMISALQMLQKKYEPVPVAASEKNFRAMMIADTGSIAELFASHPPLTKRIEALRRA